MSEIELLKLPRLEDADDLNHLLLYSSRQLNKFVLLKSQQYVSFKIPKKNSSDKRTINAPKKFLRTVQKIILKEILEKIPCSDAATAFVKGKNGLFENAYIHKDNRFLLKFDFCNFFQSIKYDKIRELFLNLGYNTKIASFLAEMCTYCRELPQGGISSPYLSNLVCKRLDDDIKQYCETKGIRYTRYADDLFFSSDDKDSLFELKKNIEQLIAPYNSESFNLQINKRKTKFIAEPWHKKVTGITINNRSIKVSKKLKRDIRQELYFVIVKNKTDYNKLIGQIAFVISIEKDYGSKIKKYVAEICLKHNIQDHPILKTLNKMAK